MYLPELNWETQVASVIKIDATHYECTVSPTNPNDPGGDTAEITVGECYLMDYVGHIFEITQVVSGTLTKVIRVLDSFGEDMGPQQGRSAYVYKSVGSGKAPYVSPVNYRRLDASAIDYALPIEKDILWRHRGLHGVGTGIDEVNLTKITIGAGLKFSDLLSTGWQGGKSVTLTAIDRYCGSGGVDDDLFIDNGNGTVTIGAKTYKLYDNVDGEGYSLEYLIAGNTFTPTDNAYSYIVANYNAGTPVLQITTDVSVINETTIIPVLSVYRDGNRLHTTPWGTIGNAKVDKLHQSIVKTQRYRRESGLAISVVATNKLSLTAGVMWIGAVRRPISQYTQGDIGGVTLALTKVAGVWTATAVASFDTTLYQNGANVATLTNNRYCVLFVFRGVETNKHIYYVYGTGDYIEADAKAAVVPSDLPPIITSHCILVGRVISQKSSTTPLEVASAFDTVFATQAGAPSHNNLAGLQGIGPDYYHLMFEQYRGVSAGSGGYLPRYNVAGWLENSKFTDDGTTPKYNANTIWHAGISNLPTVDWTTKDLNTNGKVTILGQGDTIPTIQIGSSLYGWNFYERVADGDLLLKANNNALTTSLIFRRTDGRVEFLTPPKISSLAGYLKGTAGVVGAVSSIPESDISFTDITTGNVSTSKHGFIPKLSGSATDVFKGDGTWGTGIGASPGGSSTQLQYNASGVFGGIAGLTHDSVNGLIGEGLPFKKRDISVTPTAPLVTGTVTSSTVNSITDTSKTLSVNAYVGYILYAGTGYGDMYVGIVVSNTSNSFTVNGFPIQPPAGKTYKILPYKNVANSELGSVISIVKNTYDYAVKLPSISATYDRCEVSINFDSNVTSGPMLIVIPSDYDTYISDWYTVDNKYKAIPAYMTSGVLKLRSHNHTIKHWDIDSFNFTSYT